MKTDSEIRNEVLEELKLEPSLDAGEINVAVSRGEVTLSGALSSFYKKVAAQRAAKRVVGVAAVRVDIEVTYLGLVFKNDAELADLVVTTLKRYSATDDEDKIEVRVEKGMVTLDGNVKYKYQKKAISSVVELLIGTKNIVNNLAVKPRIKPEQINQIHAGIERSVTTDAADANTQLADGAAIVGGEVRTDTQGTENPFWSAQGR